MNPKLLFSKSALTLASLVAFSSAGSAATFVWDGGAGSDNWSAANNWNPNGTPTFDNTADIEIEGTTGTGAQRIRDNTTIRSLAFGVTNTVSSTVGLISGNGTLARDLTFSSSTGSSSLTVDAMADGDKIIDDLGKVILGNDLNITQNHLTDDLRINSEISGAHNINITGMGTTYFDGANTYTGNTTIGMDSTLRMTNGAGSELAFNIGANGVNNSVLGMGSVFLHTTFALDLSAADTTVGNQWSLIDVANLDESYRSTFKLSDGSTDFTQTSAGIWDLTQSGVDYQFSEATGILTVLSAEQIPEPSRIILLGLGALGLILRRRK